MGRGKTGNFWKAAAILLGCALLTGCGNTGEVDDYATNIGYEARGSNGTTQVVQSESGSSATTQTAGIPKEEIKVGVLHLSDPADTAAVTEEVIGAAAVSAMAAVAIEDKITSSIPGTRDPAYRVQTDTHTPVFSFYGGRSDGGKQ